MGAHRQPTALYLQIKPAASNQQMKPQHLQPSSSPHCNLPRPRVAFTYDKSLPMGPTVHVGAQQRVSQQEKERNTKAVHNIVTGLLATPKRPSDKENLGTPLRTRVEAGQHQEKVIKAEDVRTVVMEDIGNRGLIAKNPSSPCLNKMPPLSPKLTQKKSTRCPSFLAKQRSQKDAQPQQKAFQGGRKQQLSFFCGCGGAITHRVIKNSQHYCSKCAINKMMEGFQLQKLTPAVPVISVIQAMSSNSRPSNQLTSKSLIVAEQVPTPEQLLSEIKAEKASLEQQYVEASETSTKNIKNYYKQKKQELKAHYQKIRQAIKQSIEEDLRQIDAIQNQQIAQVNNSITSLQNDIKALKSIEQKIGSGREKQVPKELLTLYQEVLLRKKQGNSGKSSKVDLIAQGDTLNYSAVSNLTSNGSFIKSGVRFRMVNTSSNGQIYKSDSFRLVTTTPGNGRANPRRSDISCGEQLCLLTPREQTGSAPGVAEPKSPVLFSFQGRR